MSVLRLTLTSKRLTFFVSFVQETGQNDLLCLELFQVLVISLVNILKISENAFSRALASFGRHIAIVGCTLARRGEIDRVSICVLENLAKCFEFCTKYMLRVFELVDCDACRFSADQQAFVNVVKCSHNPLYAVC